MNRNRLTPLILASATLAFVAACAQLPGTAPQQGAVIGGAAGATTGAAIAGSGHRIFGALLGGIVGAGGGYMIGAHRNHLAGAPHNQVAAQAAIDRARTTPAAPADVHRSTTADLNHDGFVTVDEVVAMTNAGLGDQEILRRLEATGHVFELTERERQQLMGNGVPTTVIKQMDRLVA